MDIFAGQGVWWGISFLLSHLVSIDQKQLTTQITPEQRLQLWSFLLQKWIHNVCQRTCIVSLFWILPLTSLSFLVRLKNYSKKDLKLLFIEILFMIHSFLYNKIILFKKIKYLLLPISEGKKKCREDSIFLKVPQFLSKPRPVYREVWYLIREYKGSYWGKLEAWVNHILVRKAYAD